ncbi:MAG: transcription elongation factor GreA [Bradymonadales bacterium]|nr:MAG: transcription elongation factor GreA [Bradymonadales bacterium]
MSDRKEPMTPQGHEKLVKELEHLKFVERPANIKAIEEARALGDLSENAEYQYAKDEQGMIAGKLARCEDLLARAEIIDPTKFEGPQIVFGASVKVADQESGEELTYRLLGSYEADVKLGSISIESPIGKALIGRSEGDEVRVRTPKGERNFVILEVSYPSA